MFSLSKTQILKKKIIAEVLQSNRLAGGKLRVLLFRNFHVQSLSAVPAMSMATNMRSIEAAPGDVSKSHSFHTKGSLKVNTQLDEKDSIEILPPKPILVSIEGNIGAGKSTLLSSLRAENPSWVFIEEPVGVWGQLKNEDGVGLLELFYSDRKRWSYTFQNCALLTRFQNIEAAIAEKQANDVADAVARFKAATSTSSTVSDQTIQSFLPTKQVYVTERCLDTDYEVFTTMLRAEGSIDKLEWDLYMRWFAQLKLSATKLSGIVWMDTPPYVCADRIRARGRSGEESIPLEYLDKLDECQRKWILREDAPHVRTNNNDMVQEIRRVQDFINQLA
jgi:deoxycitidine kinase